MNNKTYFAPMEGITGVIFRNAYEKYYGGIDKYFSPFISPTQNCPMTPKEKRDVLPENNKVPMLVPQILTCKAEHFIEAAVQLKTMGYEEINLNLGCPSQTVCAKGKGAGFLSDICALDDFLKIIYDFAEKEKMKISIKTRIGQKETSEWNSLLAIFNDYPIHELIIHPRLASDYYSGEPRMEEFEKGLAESKNPVVYNGNLFSASAIHEMEEKCPIMLGRGLLFNPQLLQMAKGEKEEFDYKTFFQFHDEMYHEYQKIMSPDINALHRMKELWTYFSKLFPGEEKVFKSLHKSKKYGDYDAACLALKTGVKK